MLTCSTGTLCGAAVVALLCGAIACGSEEHDPPAPPPPRGLTAPERQAAQSGHAAIRTYCRRLGLYIVGRRGQPAAADQRRAVAGARAIARLAQRKPEAPFAPGQTVRQLAGDTAEDLEGTNCSTRLVAELERGLRGAG
jgi:hypothetical protein